MYGTFARFKPSAGKEEEIIDLINSFESARGEVTGYRETILIRPDNEPNWYLVAVFEDQATYLKNADDPEQDRWYQKFRALLDSDPEWTDGTMWQI